jgi:hypothetical protein
MPGLNIQAAKDGAIGDSDVYARMSSLDVG